MVRLGDGTSQMPATIPEWRRHSTMEVTVSAGIDVMPTLWSWEERKNCPKINLLSSTPILQMEVMQNGSKTVGDTTL